MKRNRVFASIFLALVLIVVTSSGVWAQTTPGIEPACPTNADWGDLPDTYGTIETSGGAYHTVGSLRLGSLADIDSNGRPTLDAKGDDTNNNDDEDGIAPVGMWSVGLASAGKGGFVRITVSGCASTCYVSGFIDWNQNGYWNLPRERIIDNKPVVNGTQVIGFDIPSDTPNIIFLNQTYYARFRLVSASTSLMSPKGGQPTGEVEDYRWIFGPTAIDLREISTTSASVNGWVIPLAGVLGLAGLGWLAVRRRK